MPHFILAYHGGKRPETPEAGAELMARWRAWMEDIGASIVNPGNPVGMSKTVSSEGVADNGGSNPLSGFTIVQADTIEGACDLAKGSPHLDHGTIEIAELMNIEM